MAVAAAAATAFCLAGAQTINGAGATFPNPIYSKWFYEFSQGRGGVRINYQPIGSGGGIRQASEGTIDFGATDGPMTDSQMNSARVKTMHIPTVLGAVVPVYNVKGVNQPLNFSGDVLADIFAGRITHWNDPRIAQDNPGVSFPNAYVIPVYRSDGSGTTYVFTDYLRKVSSAWQGHAGTSVRWPTGIGEKGNEGVAGMIRQTPNTIGYVELVYATQNHMPFGKVRNASGNFIQASTQTVTAAAANVKDMPGDFRVSITNPPGADSYPIASFTWLLIPFKSADPAKGKALSQFLTWMLDHGESEAPGLNYAPLPSAVQARVRGAISFIH